MTTSPSNFDSVFYVGSGNQLLCLDRANGEILWARSIFDAWTGPANILLDADKIYFAIVDFLQVVPLL